eukprot:5378212-Karenia_brevis.AAC.1
MPLSPSHGTPPTLSAAVGLHLHESHPGQGRRAAAMQRKPRRTQCSAGVSTAASMPGPPLCA